MSGGHSKSESQQSTFVDPAQAPFLAQLRNQAQGLQGQQQQQGIGTQDFFNQAIQPLQGAAGQGIGELGQIIGGQNQFQQQLATASQQGNPFLQQVIENTQGDISRNLTQNILPAIGSAAGLAGQRGSSRQGVAEGLATQDAQRLSAEAATNLNFQGFGQQLGAGQAALGNQQAAISQLPQALQAQLGLSQAQVAGPFQNLNQLQGLIGAPSILGQGDSKSFAMQGGVG